MDYSESEAKSIENVEDTSSVPLSDYAKKLDQRVKKRYEDKMAAIGIDPVLLEGRHFEPDCLPPVEATDLLSYLSQLVPFPSVLGADLKHSLRLNR